MMLPIQYITQLYQHLSLFENIVWLASVLRFTFDLIDLDLGETLYTVTVK